MINADAQVVIFGSCLTKRDPRDIDFSFKECTFEEACAVVSQWRADNLDRWDDVPKYLHATDGVIEGDRILIAVRPGQELKVETIAGPRVEPEPVKASEWIETHHYRQCPETDRYGRQWIIGMPW